MQQQFFPFLDSAVVAFSLALSSCFSFSFSSPSFSSTFSSFLGSDFSLDGLCNCLRLSFQPEWVM